MKIIFNGSAIETDAKSTLEFFNAQNASKNDVWIINGFATQEDISLNEGDELFYIKKGQMPPKEMLEKMMRARHTPKLYDKLKKAQIGIAGLGGLGSHIAIMLARSGIGRLELIDFDIIEPSNLNRQAYEIAHLGEYKADALSKIIKNINPYMKVDSHIIRLSEENLGEFFSKCDIVCEAFDNAQAKSMIANNFHSFYPKKILICASGLAGYGDSNAIKTRKITPYLYICGDFKSAARPGNGLMAPRVNICAGHQANLVLELVSEMF